MKYLLVLLVIVVAVGIWRNNRRAGRATPPPARPTPPPAAGPAPMLSCAHCGLHLPAADAVQGRDGVYCGSEHRRLAEG